MQKPRYLICGDSALTVEFSNKMSQSVNRIIRFVSLSLDKSKTKGIIECVPTFCSLTVYYNPLKITAKKIEKTIETIIASYKEETAEKKHVFVLPVCYQGEFAPDIDFVCKHSALSRQEVINIHCGTDYLIYMLGFLPGFPYLGGLDKRIATPRLDTPRTIIPPGAVGIGGEQTGVYPLASPGGWRLIGRTPVKLYDPNRAEPILYSAGDYIRFRSVDVSEYNLILSEVNSGTYSVEVLTEV